MVHRGAPPTGGRQWRIHTAGVTGVEPIFGRPGIQAMEPCTGQVLEESENLEIKQKMDGRTDQKVMGSVVGSVDASEYRTP